MQKLNMIEAFRLLEETDNALFLHPQGQPDQARLIKMRINSPQACNLYITPVDVDVDTGEVIGDVKLGEDASIFLAHVKPGFEHIQFHYRGSFVLNVLGGAVWLDTYDNTAFSVEASDFTTYARLWEREERDPRILEIERAARHNQRILLDQMAADRAAYQEMIKTALEVKETANGVSAQAPAGGGTASGGGGATVSTGNAGDDQAQHSVDETGIGGQSNAAT